MKQTHRNPLLRNFVFAATICLTFGQAAHAGSVYWDTNGITAGSGAATGNWGSSLFWSTTEAGTVATNGTLPTADDDVFIAAGTTGTTGTITIGTTKVAGRGGRIHCGGRGFDFLRFSRSRNQYAISEGGRRGNAHVRARSSRGRR